MKGYASARSASLRILLLVVASCLLLARGLRGAVTEPRFAPSQLGSQVKAARPSPTVPASKSAEERAKEQEKLLQRLQDEAFSGREATSVKNSQASTEEMNSNKSNASTNSSTSKKSSSNVPSKAPSAGDAKPPLEVPLDKNRPFHSVYSSLSQRALLGIKFVLVLATMVAVLAVFVLLYTGQLSRALAMLTSEGGMSSASWLPKRKKVDYKSEESIEEPAESKQVALDMNFHETDDTTATLSGYRRDSASSVHLRISPKMMEEHRSFLYDD